MSADITADMATDNPYSAPDAELGNGQDELYSPSFLSFDGRIGRLRYLAYGIGANFLLLVAMMVIMSLAGAGAIMSAEAATSAIGMIGIGVFYAGTIVLTVMFGKRRLNDLNRSGWWSLLLFVPVINLAPVIYLLFFPGSEGSNNFGPAPKANSIGVLILGWMFPVLMILGIVAAIAIPQLAGMSQ